MAAVHLAAPSECWVYRCQCLTSVLLLVCLTACGGGGNTTGRRQGTHATQRSLPLVAYAIHKLATGLVPDQLSGQTAHNPDIHCVCPLLCVLNI